MNPPIEMTINTPLVTVTVKATSLKIRVDNKVETAIEYTLPSGKSKLKKAAISKGKAEIEAIVAENVSHWQTTALVKAQKAGQTFRVRQLRGTMYEPEYIWVENCKLVKLPNPPHDGWFMFQAPDAELFHVYDDAFELEQ